MILERWLGRKVSGVVYILQLPKYVPTRQDIHGYAGDPFVTGFGTKKRNRLFRTKRNQQEDINKQQNSDLLYSYTEDLDGNGARSLTARRYAARDSNARTYTQQVVARTRAYHRRSTDGYDVTVVGWPTETDTEREKRDLQINNFCGRSRRGKDRLIASFFRARTNTNEHYWLVYSASGISDCTTGVLLLLPPRRCAALVQSSKRKRHATHCTISAAKETTHCNAVACADRRSVCSW